VIAHAPVRLAPPIVCTLANRLDFFIDEDDIMWECSCEALKSGHICAWRMVAGVEGLHLRRRLKLRVGTIGLVVA
jgi:hypothetical protein